MAAIYAAFESHQAVTAAVEQLELFGFPRSSIRYATDDNFRDLPPSLKRESGFLSTLENFFTQITHASTPLPPDVYEETIRRGGTVVAVDADTAIEARTAHTLLRNAGAIDVDMYSEKNTPPISSTLAYTEADSGVESRDQMVFVGGLPMHRYQSEEDVPAVHMPRVNAPSVDPPSVDPLSVNTPSADRARVNSRSVEAYQSLHSDDGSDVTRAPAVRAPIATQDDFKIFQPGIYEVREQVEVLTVTKVARVVEELSVNKSVTVHTETLHDILRGTRVDVEHLQAVVPASGDSRSPA